MSYVHAFKSHSQHSKRAINAILFSPPAPTTPAHTPFSWKGRTALGESLGLRQETTRQRKDTDRVCLALCIGKYGIPRCFRDVGHDHSSSRGIPFSSGHLQAFCFGFTYQDGCHLPLLPGSMRTSIGTHRRVIGTTVPLPGL